MITTASQPCTWLVVAAELEAATPGPGSGGSATRSCVASCGGGAIGDSFGILPPALLLEPALGGAVRPAMKPPLLLSADLTGALTLMVWPACV